MATAVSPLTPAQLTRLVQLLDGPTGSERRRDLHEARRHLDQAVVTPAAAPAYAATRAVAS